jgi:phosphatidylserine/phosphatidylglycerophosphate/cardiolipin synthase-like enzyme
VTVRVLLDGSPVGGMSERQARQLTRLSEAGVDVRLLDGPHVRYAHHHPKYVVADDRALVLTENFKPAGTGGMSSRGWGVVVSDGELASALAELHAADRGWRAATTWPTYRKGRDFLAADPAVGDFETRHAPQQVTVAAATLLVAPDNAAAAVERRIDRAETRVLVQQVEIDSRENRLLRAVVRAAERGVTVRIQLSSGWYVKEDNAALVEWLNRRADAEGWDLTARVDDPAGYEKIHTKGVIVDDTAILGSLNWGRTAMTENREVAVALEGEAVAGYYARVFDSDWSASDGQRDVPAGLLGVVAVAIAGAALFARRIEFRGRDGVVTDWQW